MTDEPQGGTGEGPFLTHSLGCCGQLGASRWGFFMHEQPGARLRPCPLGRVLFQDVQRPDLSQGLQEAVQVSGKHSRTGEPRPRPAASALPVSQESLWGGAWAAA